MNSSRRDFIKQAAFLSGLGALGGFPESIRRAMAIEPAGGSTFLDAEHIVILMQENRSFDHTFGTLRGVRGFNDPRAIKLNDGMPVWAQPDAQGKRFLPFRLNIKDTKSTWMGSLPHSWSNQVDARNNGQYDKWLAVKDSGEKEFAGMPLTLGYYTRDDIPFYYALADAFTVCDQNFCSSLTGTTPNRLYLWSGTVRGKQSSDAKANILNSDVDYGRWADWTTFPERLSDLGVSWKVYQNELSQESGLDGEYDAWLANFTDNPLEWFTQFGVRFAPARRRFVEKRVKELPGQIAAKEAMLAAAAGDARAKLEKEIASLRGAKAELEAELATFTPEQFDALPERAKQLHKRAFADNSGDPHYRELTDLAYRDGESQRTMQVPKGDPLYQFRKDVHEGTLPTVSWLVPSERFSDHPGSAWYGAWYLSETLDILTKNPEVWKKTIFILTYDENDGYFDHVPPFVAPDPRNPKTGAVSKGIDASLEFVTLEQDKAWHGGEARENSIGLGYRVPMVIASPWSRGGNVCSQVFDHTSVIQLLEKVLSHKTGKKVHEPNISSWRRAVCGDLTSCFSAADDAAPPLKALEHDAFLEGIHKAQFKGLPTGYRALSEAEAAALKADGAASSLLPRQELGTRRSCPLPYELSVIGTLSNDRKMFILQLSAGKTKFGERSAGAPFVVYAITNDGPGECRNYAVEAGETVLHSWDLAGTRGEYHLRVYGPNGFYREFAGNSQDTVSTVVQPLTNQRVTIGIVCSQDAQNREVSVRDLAYGNAEQHIRFEKGQLGTTVQVSAAASQGWYDVSVSVADQPQFIRRFAGRAETGEWSVSDPAIGK